MRKKILIPVDIYRFEIHIWLCVPTTAARWIKDTVYGDDGDIEFKPKHAKTIWTEGTNPVIWVDSNLDKVELISCLSHEILHAIFFELLRRGSYVWEANNAEHYTYLMEYCMKTVLKEIKL